jgi:hypothetical protein
LEDHISSFALPISNLSPSPDRTGQSEPSIFESRADVEKKLTAIWMEVLGARSITCDQDFFDIGGESVQAIHLVTQMNRKFNAALNVSLVFEARTIESQAIFSSKPKNSTPASRPWWPCNHAGINLHSFSLTRSAAQRGTADNF